jgi:tetrahydromethanopterin S-methyltransferase subunit H
MSESITITVDQIKIGGHVGENPTALVGSIFYDRHAIVKDLRKGDFDESEAERLIREQDEWSAKTGCPAMLDVVGSTPEAICRYLEFITGITKSPLLIDGSSPLVRLAGMEWCAAHGILDRAIYNSLSWESKPEEFQRLKELGCQHAVILCINNRDFTLQGRIQILEGWEGKSGLITLAGEAGIDNLLVDPGIVDLPSIGTARAFLAYVKEAHGLVVGAAPHNAISCWKGLRTKLGKDAVRPCTAVTDALMTAWGGDFVLYGPIAQASLAFPVVALVDAALGQLRIEAGKLPEFNHPIFKIV